MANERPSGLLGADDPAPVSCSNAPGSSPFLLTGDHAGRAIPGQLERLGMSEQDLGRHIALDIGIAALGEMLSARLDAAFVAQSYSRLVIDCNRDPLVGEAIPSMSDGVAIPGNAGLTNEERGARVRHIHQPYHDRIAAELDARASRGQESIFIALHSFTPTLAGVPRPWDVGVLHEGGDESFARCLLDALACEPGLKVGDNQPYHLDATDHSVPRHAFARNLPYAEIELRQDLIADDAGRQHWAELLIAALQRAHSCRSGWL
jgi:predicted N-formylglutamate amidohydrolase